MVDVRCDLDLSLLGVGVQQWKLVIGSGRRRRPDRNIVGGAEFHEVLEAGGDERVARAQRGDRNRVGPAIPALGFGEVAGALTDEPEVVQRDREIRMIRTECGFLYDSGFTQQALGGEIVAIGGGPLRSLDHGCGIESIAHGSGHSTRK